MKFIISVYPYVSSSCADVDVDVGIDVGEGAGVDAIDSTTLCIVCGHIYVNAYVCVCARMFKIEIDIAIYIQYTL